MWDLLGSGVKPVPPVIGRWVVNHCAARETPIGFLHVIFWYPDMLNANEVKLNFFPFKVYAFCISSKNLVLLVQFSSVQSLSHTWLFATPWTVACHTFLSIANSRSLLKLMSIESVIPSNHLILCCPLLLLPSFFPSIRVFSKGSFPAPRIKCPKYWSFSFSISPSNEYLGLISFRMDWFDRLAVQGTLKSLLQHHSLKTSILQCLSFFMVHLSHLYMTTGKTRALTIWIFVGKVMSLLFNMLSRLVIVFL